MYKKSDFDTSEPIVVTLTGDLGSGKTVVSEKLAELLSASRHSAGKIQRDAARAQGRSTLDLNQDPLASSWLDQQIDGRLKQFEHSKESVIIDARMGWHFIPSSFRIKLLTKPSVAASRIYGDSNREDEKYGSIDEAEAGIKDRQKAEWDRFLKKYGANFYDDSNFDLVIDTSFASVDAIFDIVKQCLHDHLNGNHYNKYWLSPQQLLPTEDIIDKADSVCNVWVPNMKENGYANDYPVHVVPMAGRYFIFDGHKRTFSAASAGNELIPAHVSYPWEIMNSGKDTYGLEIESAFRLSFVYDWQDGIQYCRGTLGLEKMDFSVSHSDLSALAMEGLAVSSQATLLRGATYAPQVL